MEFQKLANLRPGLPMGMLAEAFGDAWQSPEYGDLGRIRVPRKNEKKFAARLDAGQMIGELSFSTGFPESHRIEGLFVCMRLDKALAQRPQLTPLPAAADGNGADIAAFIDRSEPGYDIVIQAKGQQVSDIILRSRDAVYPAFEPADPGLKDAFNIWPGEAQLLPASLRGAEWENGWAFGLPPGIEHQHWPLNPRHGYPLRHAFTLRLPPEYRVKSEKLVALSLFVGDMAENAPDLEGFDPTQLVSHPQSFTMEDAICRSYVAIWLTQEEFDGPLCYPPMPPATAQALDFAEIKWMSDGYALHFAAPRDGSGERLAWPPGEGKDDLRAAFPISSALRQEDPNVGIPPREEDEEDGAERAYIAMFSDEGEKLGFARFHEAPHVHHLGGTMYGNAESMYFGPYYLEFHEDFAGCNLAGGDIQIDLKRMVLNWSH
ncbi:DUF7256 domain-containing protein [Pseudoduganella sp. HUAS MS19]